MPQIVRQLKIKMLTIEVQKRDLYYLIGRAKKDSRLSFCEDIFKVSMASRMILAKDIKTPRYINKVDGSWAKIGD